MPAQTAHSTTMHILKQDTAGITNLTATSTTLLAICQVESERRFVKRR